MKKKDLERRPLIVVVDFVTITIITDRRGPAGSISYSGHPMVKSRP
jgi:hypothetical protein